MSRIDSHFETIQNEAFSWIDIQKPNRENMEELGKKFSFHQLNLDDCLSKIQLPKIDMYEDHMFIILHLPPIKRENGPKFNQLNIFIGKNYLVTVHQGDLDPLLEMYQICKTNKDERNILFGTSPAFLLHKIIDSLVDELFHTLKRIEASLDEIEEAVFDERKSDAHEISTLRREITSFRRIVIPLRRTILEISKGIKHFSTEDLTLYFDDVVDHIDKVLETIEESKETMDIYKDTDFLLSTQKTNKILALLTIIFTLSIPATTIAAFYGMNINFPGSNAEPWNILGRYTTLVFILSVSAVPTILMFWHFYRRGWFSE
ncbi:MAG TPA: magnesium transporter CorA family protein [Nitrosopumilaceae archaeon]|nr:magnesium transporter CorA family protein [Nitrosopumilaceae archaeon]